MDDGIHSTRRRVGELFDEYVKELKMTTSCSNWEKIDGYGKNWIKPAIGTKKISGTYAHEMRKDMEWTAASLEEIFRDILSEEPAEAVKA